MAEGLDKPFLCECAVGRVSRRWLCVCVCECVSVCECVHASAYRSSSVLSILHNVFGPVVNSFVNLYSCSTISINYEPVNSSGGFSESTDDYSA